MLRVLLAIACCTRVRPQRAPNKLAYIKCSCRVSDKSNTSVRRWRWRWLRWRMLLVFQMPRTLERNHDAILFWLVACCSVAVPIVQARLQLDACTVRVCVCVCDRVCCMSAQQNDRPTGRPQILSSARTLHTTYTDTDTPEQNRQIHFGARALRLLFVIMASVLRGRPPRGPLAVPGCWGVSDQQQQQPCRNQPGSDKASTRALHGLSWLITLDDLSAAAAAPPRLEFRRAARRVALSTTVCCVPAIASAVAWKQIYSNNSRPNCILQYMIIFPHRCCGAANVNAHRWVRSEVLNSTAPVRS